MWIAIVFLGLLVAVGGYVLHECVANIEGLGFSIEHRIEAAKCFEFRLEDQEQKAGELAKLIEEISTNTQKRMRLAFEANYARIEQIVEAGARVEERIATLEQRQTASQLRIDQLVVQTDDPDAFAQNLKKTFEKAVKKPRKKRS